MTPEEVNDAVAAVFVEAGWAPHPGLAGYCRQASVGWLVGGAPDPARPLESHMKVTAKVPDSPETPDDPVEAARVLVAKYRRTLAISFEAFGDLPNENPVPASQETEQAAETVEDFVSGGGEAPSPGDHGGAQDGPAGGGGALQPHHGQDGEGDSEREYAFDADYEEVGEELGAELLDESAVDLPALENALIEALQEGADVEHELPPQDRFYGLDDLDRVRKLRIGDVAAEAATLVAEIEAEASEHEGEYAAVQAFVVTNLDKFTGAFTLQDPASIELSKRFYELDAARGRIQSIERKRKEATAFLLTAERQQVVEFDVTGAFA